MHLNHMNEYQNSMKRQHRAGITPAQFALDMMRLDDMVLHVRTDAAARAASTTQPKSQRANPGTINPNILLRLARRVKPLVQVIT